MMDYPSNETGYKVPPLYAVTQICNNERAMRWYCVRYVCDIN